MAARTSTSSLDSTSHKDNHHHLKPLFPGLHLGRSGSKDGSNFFHKAPATLDWKLESPPIVFYGDAESSTGALVSGQLYLHVTEEDGHDFESFNATLSIHVTQKRPFVAHCHDCSTQVTELKRWVFLEKPLHLAKGQHAFPFSILLEGHLPTTLEGAVVSISYHFKAEAISAGSSHSSVKFEKTLDVKRVLMEHETPHHSVRVFPPTNIKASVHYPQVIHPIGNNTLSLRLDGLSKHIPKPDTIEYWRLKKLTWRLEETAKTIAPACAKHAPKESADSDETQAHKKGLLRTDTRVIGEKTLFSGWKSNYSSVSDSSVEIELDYHLSKGAKYNCNAKSRDGTEVTHQLMVEMVVSQEYAQVGKPNLVTQTGVGRILRMHFATVLTDRAGLGISWDNEAPPVYQDVPPSPPSYMEETRCLADGTIEEAIEPLDSVLHSAVAGGSAAGPTAPSLVNEDR